MLHLFVEIDFGCLSMELAFRVGQEAAHRLVEDSHHRGSQRLRKYQCFSADRLDVSQSEGVVTAR